MAVPSSSQYDVFLSHSSVNKPAVEELALWLVREGLTPFLDKWHLVPGEDWTDALPQASAIALRALSSSGQEPREDGKPRRSSRLSSGVCVSDTTRPATAFASFRCCCQGPRPRAAASPRRSTSWRSTPGSSSTGALTRRSRGIVWSVASEEFRQGRGWAPRSWPASAPIGASRFSTWPTRNSSLAGRN